MCDRRPLSEQAAESLGAMLTDLGDAVRVRVAAGAIGPAFDSGSQEREGTGVGPSAQTIHPSPTTAPGCRLSGQTGRGRSGHVVRDAAAEAGNGAGDGGGPAPGVADLAALQLAQEHGRLLDARTRIRQLERQVRSLERQVAWWHTRACESTLDRGTVVTGEIGHAWDAGAAEQRLRAAARLLRRAESDQAAMQSASWREELRELLRFVEGPDAR